MGNTITRFTHHKSRHVHHEVSIPVPVPTPPPNHIDDSASNTNPAQAAQTELDAYPPRKPSLDPVPEAIIAAAESGMISENLLCSCLPSPVLRQQPRSQSEPEAGSGVARREYGYFPAAPGSVGSTRSGESHVQPRHEGEVGEGKRGSVGSERRVRWKGVDV